MKLLLAKNSQPKGEKINPYRKCCKFCKIRILLMY